MPTYRSINISLHSQFDIETLPEYYPPPAPSPSLDVSTIAPLINDTTSTCSVYIPALPGSQFWITYSVSPPVPEGHFFLFKLYVDGENVLSWSTAKDDAWMGKTMFGLFDAGDAKRVEKRVLCFSAPDKEGGAKEGCVEIRVLRASGRKRVERETKVYEKMGHAKKDGGISLVNAGRAGPEQPKRFYRFALIDPADQPFATFRYHYRTWEQLRDLGLLDNKYYAESEGNDMSVIEPEDGSITGDRSKDDAKPIKIVHDESEDVFTADDDGISVHDWGAENHTRKPEDANMRTSTSIPSSSDRDSKSSHRDSISSGTYVPRGAPSEISTGSPQSLRRRGRLDTYRLSMPPSITLSAPEPPSCPLPLPQKNDFTSSTAYRPHPAYPVEEWTVRTPTLVSHKSLSFAHATFSSIWRGKKKKPLEQKSGLTRGRTKKTVVEEVPPTKPSEAELGGAAGSHGVFKGLWVGIQVSNANDYRLKAGNGFPRGKHAPKSGDGRQRKSIAQIIAAGKMIELPHDPKALRVVVNIDTLDSRVYVLANPDKNGLCQALPTQTEIVWYAPEYRDDSETRSEFARKACNAKIKLQLDTIKNRTMETTARPSRYTEFLPQHPTVTVMIELRRAFDDFRLWKGEGSLQKALKSVESLSKDLRARKQCEDRKILDHLLDIKRGFKPDEEKAAHKAVKNLFRGDDLDVLFPCPGPVGHFAVSIRKTSQFVRYSTFRFIIHDWARKWGKVEGLRDFEEDLVADEMADTIEAAKQYGPTEPAVYQEDDEDSLRALAPLFIKQEMKLLSALSMLQKARTDQLRKVVGPPTTTLDLKEIVQKYLVSAIDRDEAYVWSNEGLGYLLECLLQNNMHDYRELDDEVERLQGLLRVLDADDDDDDEEEEGDDDAHVDDENNEGGAMQEGEEV